MISLIRTNPWNIRFFQKPVGNTASNSFWETSVEIVSFCSDFNARDILNSERHLSASSRAESKLINSQSEFAFFLFLDLSLARRKCSNDAQMTHLACDWQLGLNRTNQELRSWANGVCKIVMTSGKRYLRLPTPTPLLIFDRRPPPWYKFLSLPSVLLPLKSRVVPKFSSRKCRALARQNYVYSGYKSNTENVTVCIRILTTSLRNKKIQSISQ